MDILYDDDYIQIRIDPPKKLLTYEWKKFVSENTFKSSLERVYDTICSHDVDKCLINRTKFSILPPHLLHWWENFWFPRIRDSGIKKIAVVCLSSNIKNLAIVHAYIAQEEILRTRN